MTQEPKPRGTAGMTERVRKKVARCGGKALKKKYGKNYFKKLGSIGGAKVSQDREHMARIGAIGRSRRSK